jgi:hypothetical protein
VNTRCRDLVVSLRAQLASVPGAGGLSVNAIGGWVWILISALDEASARHLAEDYGLGDPVVRSGPDGTSWLRAMSAGLDEDLGEVRVEVVGPHRTGKSTIGGAP